jgi:dTDP-4-dehydrorhamnose reductase
VKRVLLIGGSGQLGAEILRRWDDCDVAAPSHRELDIAHRGALRAALERIRPDIVVNCAAFADVDRCESEPERAFEVNALAVAAAAALAREHDAAFLTISTDYVFDGAAGAPYVESDAPHPLSAYGASKLAGELLVEQLHSRAFVVRTCGLYGDAVSAARMPLIERVLTHPPDAEPMRVVADVVASPTFAGHLAGALRRLIETQSYGLYHAVDAGAVSWYDFASEAAHQAEVAVAIDPIAAAQWRAPAVRPRYSALRNANLDRLGIAMPSWRDGIAAYLALRVR